MKRPVVYPSEILSSFLYSEAKIKFFPSFNIDTIMASQVLRLVSAGFKEFLFDLL